MTSYPLPQQYQQALQKPRLSLFDDELKNGTIQADRMGLPRVRSGNFASVYKVFAGSSQYAIKCFLNAPDDIQTRYEEISTYLNTINCEYFLKTHYLARGIAVNGHTYPILKIKWQDGTPLDKYIDDCVRRQDTQGILNIRARFVNLYRTLRSYHIAHGDLQHGNILITQQGLRLIDYDGLYVPTTTLNISHESGHPNYQHPKRTTWHFNEHMDTFSATAIFTALTILAYDLSLWAKFYNGDNILFCGKDFLNTNQSPLFRRLAGIDDATIKQLVTAIAASCLSQKPPDSPDFLELCADATVSGQEMPLPPIAPISPHSWITTWEGLPTQSDIDIVEAVPIANPGPVDASIRKAEDRPSTIPAPPTPPQPKPHTL
ncbi:MAG: hypothetical protein HQL01_14515, partial [Nitrospirae bacterium]|nr:hypothetical protein [Nitrospirota bacterium]